MMLEIADKYDFETMKTPNNLALICRFLTLSLLIPEEEEKKLS